VNGRKNFDLRQCIIRGSTQNMNAPGKLAVALCSVLLFGCAAEAWRRPDTTKEDMRRDLEQCQRDREAVAGESFFVERCMFSKGYTEE
jgi:hypothetical protein